MTYTYDVLYIYTCICLADLDSTVMLPSASLHRPVYSSGLMDTFLSRARNLMYIIRCKVYMSWCIYGVYAWVYMYIKLLRVEIIIQVNTHYTDTHKCTYDVCSSGVHITIYIIPFIRAPGPAYPHIALQSGSRGATACNEPLLVIIHYTHPQGLLLSRLRCTYM